MRFNCGESWDDYFERVENWHPWFAWRPVRVGSHDCRWLETVERKVTFGPYTHVCYRPASQSKDKP